MNDGEIRHTTKPDLSNMLKNIEDVGNGVIWKDDKLIDQIMIRKYYGHEPGWRIRLEW
jgi:Holliday junction resolvase RusA-like endonuclease